MNTQGDFGIVVIGRNEGERLRACLESVTTAGRPVVYVDSGSTDGSVWLASSLGVEVVELDPSVPFTAARARNAGWQRLSGVKFVQFVDGDCVVARGWLQTSAAFMLDHPTVVAVCGRRRERQPERSIYNRLCDLEWDTPPGESESCGGDAMFRLAALQAAGGYRDAMIAGEEPELCHRLRQAGGRIVRLDAEMTLHDAAIESFAQWWRRAVRSGYGYADGAALTSGALWGRDVRSAWFWGAILPGLALGWAIPTRGWSLLLFLAYPAHFVQIARRCRWARRASLAYAANCVVAKFAQMVGILRYHRDRLFRRRGRLIEYKRDVVPMGSP